VLHAIPSFYDIPSFLTVSEFHLPTFLVSYFYIISDSVAADLFASAFSEQHGQIVKIM
jgi:hypothetical protein